MALAVTAETEPCTKDPDWLPPSLGTAELYSSEVVKLPCGEQEPEKIPSL